MTKVEIEVVKEGTVTAIDGKKKVEVKAALNRSKSPRKQYVEQVTKSM